MNLPDTTPTRQEIAADLRRLAPLVEDGSLDVRDFPKRLRITLWLFDRSDAERVLAQMTRAFGLPKVSQRDTGFVDFQFGAITIGISETIATRTETVTSTRDERVLDESLVALCEKHRVDDDHVMDVVAAGVHRDIADTGGFDLGPDETDPAPEPALDYDGDGRRYRDGDHS